MCHLLPLLTGCPSPFLLDGRHLGSFLGLGGVLGCLGARRLWGQWGENLGRVGWGGAQGCRPGGRAGGTGAGTVVEFEKVVELFGLVAQGLQIAEVDWQVGMGGLCWR